MSKKLYFETTNAFVTRAQALVWIANGLSFLDLFENSSGKLLSKIIDECPEQKTLLINFKGIVRFEDHCLDDVYNSLEGNKKQIIIINGEHLLGELIKLKKDKQINISHDSLKRTITIGNSRHVDIDKIFNEREEIVEIYIRSILKSTFTEFDDFKRLCSTPFLAKGEFDSKIIVESPNDFMWISFYLSDKLTRIIEIEKLNDIVLVSASLRGAVFTSILGILNDLDYLNIDHIGPIHKVYDINSLEEKHRNKNYIFIGDFVFGGTEIKLTKAYSSFWGANLNHALVLGSLFKPEVFTDFRLYELTILNEISSDKNYKLFD
jgi:hypothetical protein